MKVKLLSVAIMAALSAPGISQAATIKAEDISLDIGGVIQYDIDWFDGEAFNAGDTSGSDSEIRRGQIYVAGSIANDWSAKLRVDFKDGGDVSFADAFIKYHGWQDVELTLGKHKEPFGLELLGLSYDSVAIERTMVTSAITPGGNLGASIGNATNDYTWALGVYDRGGNDEHVNVGVSGRLTVSPINDNNNALHLGIGFTQGHLPGNTFGKASQNLEVNTANYQVGSPAIAGESMSAYNVELVYAANSFQFQSEYFDAEVDNSGLTSDTELSGYYAQFSYLLTGESRSYNKGQFGSISPNSKSGAWEIFGRLSHYAPGDDEADAYTFGLNYYANDAVRIGFNYITGDVTANNLSRDGDAISIRVQYVL